MKNPDPKSTRTKQDMEQHDRSRYAEADAHEARALELELEAQELRASGDPAAADRASWRESAARNRRALAARCRANADRYERKVTA